MGVPSLGGDRGQRATYNAPVRLISCALALVAATAMPVLAQEASTPPCADRTRSAPVLERYDQLTPGARFRVTLRADPTGRTWTPAPQLGMPFHHASALAYVGFTLPPVSAQTLELEIEAIERVAHAPRGGTFFFTYRVRVLSACWVDPAR